jgi:MFS family permease
MLLKPAAALGAYYFAYFAYVGAYSPYITLYLKDIGMTAAQIGLLYSIPQVMRIVGPGAWGHLADHTGRPYTILRLATVCSLAGFAGVYFGSTFAWLFVVLAVMHFFTSAQMPLVEAITLDLVRETPGQYGRIRVWGSVGFIVAVMGLGVALDYLPVGVVLHVTTGLLALVVLAAWHCRRQGIISARWRENPWAPGCANLRCGFSSPPGFSMRLRMPRCTFFSRSIWSRTATARRRLAGCGVLVY